MAMLYKLHNQGQDRFVYTCNNCKKHVETRYHCTVCDDFDLCITCFEKDGHPHKMEKLSFGLDDDSGTSDQKAVNPQESHAGIQRCIQSVVHACQCRDANCRLPSCQKMKRVVQHAKSCQRKTNGGCPICKQLIALCCYHTKRCQKSKCPVPFCLNIKQCILQQRMQQLQISKRGIAAMPNIGMFAAGPERSPGTSTSSNQPSSSPQSHTSPHTSQPGIGTKPTIGPPIGALQAVQQIQAAAAAHQQASHMVTAGNYGEGPPFGQPVQGKPSMIPAQQQMQVQMQKPIPRMKSGVPNRMSQGMDGWKGLPYARQSLQGQPHQPQPPPP